ncbi:DUF222 domain-containing protein [Actinomycetes bacterium KLBMP 9797]
MPDTDLQTVLATAHAAQELATAITAHAIREADGRGLPKTQHATSTAAWLRGVLRIDLRQARQLIEIAADLHRRPALDKTLSLGVVNAGQARAIGDVLRELPDHVGAEVRDAAEAKLLELAQTWEPASLRRFGARILAHVAPELADQADEEALRRQEKRAAHTRAFTLSNMGDGRYKISGWLSAEAAAIVANALDPLCKPTRGDDRTPAQRRADALVSVCESALAGGELPDNGGDRPQVVVSVGFDVLRQRLGSGSWTPGIGSPPNRFGRWPATRSSSRSCWAARDRSWTWGIGRPAGSNPPHPRMDQTPRANLGGQRRPTVRRAPSPDPPRRLGGPPRRRRATRVSATTLCGPRAQTPPQHLSHAHIAVSPPHVRGRIRYHHRSVQETQRWPAHRAAAAEVDVVQQAVPS